MKKALRPANRSFRTVFAMPFSAFPLLQVVAMQRRPDPVSEQFCTVGRGEPMHSITLNLIKGNQSGSLLTLRSP